MKHFILFLLLNCILFSSCKIDKKTSSSNLVNTTQQDSVIKQDQVVQEIAKSLKEKLIGSIYRKTYEIPEFEYFGSGGFSLTKSNDEKVFNGKEYSIKKIKYDNEKIKYLVFNELHSRTEKGKAIFKIIDILEIDKETDVYKKYPKKEIIIYSNVLLNGKRDSELFALATYSDLSEIKEVFHVWRANRATGKLEEIKELSNIKVLNDPM